jgi:integrase
MSGSVSEIRPGVWKIRVSCGFRADGRRRYLTRTIRGGKREAKAVCAELTIESNRLRLRAGDLDADTLAAWLALWMASRRAMVSAHTLETQARAIRLHIAPNIGAVKLRQLSGTGLSVFYADLIAGGLAPASVHAVHALLHTALKQAQRDGLIADNPTDFANLPKRRRMEAEVPSHDDIARVLAANAGRWEATAILVLLATGIRRGECVGLCWRDLDLEAGQMRVERNVQVIGGQLAVLPPKSEAGRRKVQIPETLVAHLKDYRRRQLECMMGEGVRPEDDIDFPSMRWGLQRPSTFGWAIKAAGARASILLSPHMLRHRFATDMLLGSVDVRIAQSRLGHAKAETTRNIYQHVIECAQQGATDIVSEVLGRVTSGTHSGHT